MTRISNKLIAGITLAIVKKLITREQAEYYEQNMNELYAILDKHNYRFHNDRQMWVERVQKKRRPAQVQVMKSPVPATKQEIERGVIALMRVIAHHDEMNYILSQISELIPCLDAEITSTSKPYPNDNNWERVYLRIIFHKENPRD